jgi:hypothetical protein
MSDAFEGRKREGFETLRPSEPETGRYDDLKADQTWERAETAEAVEVDVWNAYVRACGEAYQRHGFSFSRGADDRLINSLTLPEPQNAVEDAALKGWLDNVEKAIGLRPEIVFEARQTQEAAAAPIAAEQSTTLTGEPQREAEATISASRPDGNLLSPLFIANRVGEALARVADIALGAVIGYFVDEPKLTAAQVHDTLQARGNVETIHANEVAAAERENLAAHDWQNLMTKSGQQEHDLNAAMATGGNATAEAQLNEVEPVRERQRSRHL